MATTTTTNIYENLSKINVDSKLKQKMGLSYLSWAAAWDLLKKNYPDAELKIYTRTTKTTTVKEITDDGVTTTITEDNGEQEIPYFTDGNTCFVKVGVTIQGIEYFEIYPIMDYSNKAIKLRNVTFVDVNKAIQRAFVKCVARHGLGLYVYTGEEFDDGEAKEIELKGGDDFESAKQDLITLAVSLLNDKKYSAEVTRYIQEVFKGKKLSQTEESDLSNIITARDYFIKLHKGE